MDKQEVKARIEKLRKEVNHHRYLYHVFDRQEISDAALDSLKGELAKLEKQFPDLITKDSPTQRVGGRALEKFKKVRHTLPMLSLNDAFSEEDLGDWESRVKKLSDGAHFSYFSELKIDGFAISLIYEDGVFVEGSTRGDGTVGEDVTENLKTVDSIPLRLEMDVAELEKHREINAIFKERQSFRKYFQKAPKRIEVRGEVFMTKKAFDGINKAQKKAGLAEFANPRNIAAGSVRQLDPRVTALRRLDFLAYDLITNFGQETHEEEHLIAKILGFKTVEYTNVAKDVAGIHDFWKKIFEKRDHLPYLIDGIVVQVNQNKIFERLGVVGKAPRGAVAYKFPAKESTTIVEDIIVQVGRTGTITPVAVLRPVEIGGVTVSRATLHNIDEVKRLDVRVGDTVIVQRAGDVIPQVTAVLKGLRPKNTSEFRMPKKCPICRSVIEHKAGEVAYRCSNKNCGAVQREKIYHFVSKGAFDIQGLGPKIIDALLDHGLIRDSSDLFLLKEENIEPLERFGDKSAANLVSAIQDKKHISLGRFIYALGIQHVGEEKALDLAAAFGSFDAFSGAGLEELLQVPDIGEVVAGSITDWFKSVRNQELVKKFKKAGLKIEGVKISKKKQILSGKTFVLTGGLSVMTRDEAKAAIRDLGGDISESVSQKTDYVVVGQDSGAKREKAEQLGVKTVSEKEFIKLTKGYNVDGKA